MAADSRRSETVSRVLARTGIDGLDNILRGGLTPSRLYLLEGAPGSGKTTLAMQFLLEGGSLRRARLVRNAVGIRGGTSRNGSLAWLVDGRHHDPRTRSFGSEPAA